MNMFSVPKYFIWPTIFKFLVDAIRLTKNLRTESSYCFIKGIDLSYLIFSKHRAVKSCITLLSSFKRNKLFLVVNMLVSVENYTAVF